MTTTLQDRLRDLLLERSVRRGDFVLASDRRSSFYVDARPTTMSGEGLAVSGGDRRHLAALGGFLVPAGRGLHPHRAPFCPPRHPSLLRRPPPAAPVFVAATPS